MPDPKPQPIYWPYVAAAYGSLFALGSVDNTRGPLFPSILEELSLSDTMGGAMFAVACVGTAFGAPLFRRILRRLSLIRSQQLGLVIISLGIVGLGLSQGPFTLVLASLVFGLGGGGLTLTQNVLVERATPPLRRRQALAGLHSVYGLASLIAPLVTVAFLTHGFSWRTALFWFAVLPLVAAAAMTPVVLLERPPVARGAGTVSWNRRYSALVAGAITGAVGAELLISTRLVTLLQREGASATSAGLYLSGFFLCLLVGRTFVGLVRLRIGNRHLLLGCTVAAIVLFLLGLWVHPVFLSLTALPLGPLVPVTLDLVSDELPAHFEQTLSMVVFVVSLMLAVIHEVCGVISDLFDLQTALMMGPVVLIVTVFALVLSGRVELQSSA